MKRAAIVVAVSSLFFLGAFLPGEEKADHESSPAFSASLERAVNMLEGAVVEVTAAATPRGSAKTSEPTVDEHTCAGYSGCEPTGELICGTTSEYTCENYPTCESTCELALTCYHTCEHYPGCEPTGELICGPDPTYDFTCEHYSTCESTCELSPTCQYTCELHPECEPTVGICGPTSYGEDTCYDYTCLYYPGCEPTGNYIDTCTPGDPLCQSSAGRTSWGAIKDMF